MPQSSVESTPYPAMRLVIILLALNAISYIDRSILTIVAPQIMADLGLTLVQISLILGTGFVLFFVAAGIPIGWLVDRAPRRWLVFGGVTIWSLAASSAGLARDFWSLFAARLGVGAGEASMNPSSYSMITDAVPRKRLNFALSAYSSGASLGSAMSVMIGGVLLAWALRHGDFDMPLIGVLKPWQFVLLMSGVPGLVLAGSVFLIPEPQRRERLSDTQALPPGALMRFIRANWQLICAIIGSYAVIQIFQYAVGNWQPTYLVEHFGFDIADAGLIAGFAGLVSFVGGFANGWIVDRMAVRGRADAPLLFAGFASIISGGLMGTAMLLPRGDLYIVAMLAGMFPCALIGVLASALQQITPNEFRGRLSAIYLLVGNLLGFGVGPLVPAMLAEHVFGDRAMLGVSLAILCFVAAPLAALIAWSGLRRMREAVANGIRLDADSPSIDAAVPVVA